MADNKARQILWPSDPTILVRGVSLYVGQGTSTVILVKDGGNYRALLNDINLDAKNGGVNVPSMMADLLEKKPLDIFINSHPHDDHIRGISDLHKMIGIHEVWHSGHKPSRNHNDAYKELQEVIKEVKRTGGKEVLLKGSREEMTIGDARYYVLSPAEYVVDDIEGEDADTRDRRIHEQCAVLKFGRSSAWIMLPGDADRDAFEKHITQYHKERLKAALLMAPHHGSRTFFRYNEEDEPYLDALNEINPSYVIVSAPKQEDSKHDHPHQDAMELYRDKVGDQLYHTGEKCHCFIFDIFDNGSTSSINSDEGVLAKAYPIDSGNDDDKPNKGGYTKRDDISVVAGARYAE